MKIRKKRMLQFLKQCALLFIIPFFLYNCEKEENIVENEVPQNTFEKNYTLEKIKYKELAKDAAFLKPFTKLSNTFNNKSTDDKENRNELSILTDEIARIETANSITWTFELENKLKEASIFENLLVQKQDNEFNYYLISYQEENDTEDGKNSKQSLLYTLSEEEFNFDNINLQSKDHFTTPEGADTGGGTTDPCNGTWIPEYNHCDAGGDANGHSPQRQWNGRYCSGSPLIGYIIDFSHCSNYQPPAGPGNNSGTGTTVNNNGGTTGGGGSSNTNDNNNNSSGGTTITTPIQNVDGTTTTAAEIAARNVNRALGNTLSLSELSWLSQEANFNFTTFIEGFLFTNTSDDGKKYIKDSIDTLMEGVDIDFEDKICLSSLKFNDVGSNWQAAGIKNLNIRFLTIGKPTKMVNVFINELYIGFPKNSSLVGGFLTNNNARYLGQEIITKAERLTDLYQSINPKSNHIQLKDYFYKKLSDFARENGGRISTTPPLGWSGELKQHQSYIISSGIECD